MAWYVYSDRQIKIFFDRKPSEETLDKMKKVRYRWNPEEICWATEINDSTIKVAKEICGENYGLKVKIGDIVSADDAKIGKWVNCLNGYISRIYDREASDSQKEAWKNCFEFIRENLNKLSEAQQEFELIFEYSLRGTAHERPDVILLTNIKVISLEFKKKDAPQIDENKDDVAQAIRYKEYLQNHHEVTKKRKMNVISYLVCTGNAKKGNLRGIDILTKDNFCEVIEEELNNAQSCSFSAEWLNSPRTEQPDMLIAIGKMYRAGTIPYVSDANQDCLKQVRKYIKDARDNHKKILILINGVPGAGKTAVGQSIVFKENENGKANAVYLSGNGPLVDVLRYQINKAANKDIAGNAIKYMRQFMDCFWEYFGEKEVPQQSILVFDEAQRAWDEKKMAKERDEKYGVLDVDENEVDIYALNEEITFSEPEGLFRICDRIYKRDKFAVLIGLYGNGQVIYEGEESGLVLWEAALKKHDDWTVIASNSIASQLNDIGTAEKKVDNTMFLSTSIRADFVDCSKWVDLAIGINNANPDNARTELEKIQKTSMRIFVTRSMDAVKKHCDEIKANHPEWKYGLMVSNYAKNNVIQKALPGWNVERKGANAVNDREYGPWFSKDCRKLEKACSVFGNQGLELDVPIVVFAGEYVRDGGMWKTKISEYNRQKYENPDTIVENNFRVLLTRAKKELILLIPEHPDLNETYNYFVGMGMDELK